MNNSHKLNKLFEVNQLKSILMHLPSKNSEVHLPTLKERIHKRIVSVSKQFSDMENFINKQTGIIRSCPTNLLYYKLLEFYASKLTGGNWQYWSI